MSWPPELQATAGGAAAEREPAADPPAEVETARALRLVARREHELLALAELSQELTISLDLYGVADLVLFNLMGQLGTSRAAMWAIGDDPARTPVLLRSHGIQKPMATALGRACAAAAIASIGEDSRLLFGSELAERLPPAGALLLRQEAIALFAPIVSRGELLGLLALGPRIDGAAYGPVELQVLQTSMGMVGVALHNTTLYNRLLENNRRLRVANEELTHLDGLKSEFLRNVNHELRTPLTVTIAYLSCMLDLVEHGSRAHEFTTVALAESQKLQGLLENLLEFASAEGGQLPLEIVTGSVAEVLVPYHRERLPGITEGLREFSFESGPDVPAARFDRRHLLHVLDALVENAVKFTPRGTHIGLRLTRDRDADAVWVRVDVRDDGPGIPQDRLSALFRSFQQGDGSTTRSVGGMGMGLALARQLAEHMGARLTVASELGRGSAFTLWLPAAA